MCLVKSSSPCSSSLLWFICDSKAVIERAFKLTGVQLTGDTTQKFKAQQPLVSGLIIVTARKGRTLERAPFWGRKKKEGNWRPSTGTTCSGTSGSNQRDQAKSGLTFMQFYLAKFRRSDWLKGVQEEDLINLVPLNVESVPRAVLSFGFFVCLFVLNFK